MNGTAIEDRCRAPSILATGFALAAALSGLGCASGEDRGDSRPMASAGAKVLRIDTALTPPAGAGPLVVVGGGAIPETIRAAFIDLAGGPDATILVFGHASARPDSGERLAGAWRDAGARHVSIAPGAPWDASTADPEARRRIGAELRDAIVAADALWFGGGSQNRLMEALASYDVVEVIITHHRSGKAVGGTSAGAAVMSGPMLTGTSDLERIAVGTTELAEGLGLWPGVIVDQHFVRRRRFHRLLSAVLDRPSCVGVGIDEGTAVIVDPSRWRVIGEGTVVTIDPRNASLSAANTLHRAGGVAIDVLVDGDIIECGATSERTAHAP